MEGKGGEDRDLRRSIVTVNIGGRICFCVAEVLGEFQGVVEGHPVGFHLVKDEVRGAVEDSHDGLDPVTRQGFAQAVHNGDGAGNGGFVVDVDVGFGGGLINLGAMGGKQCLVAGDNGSAVLNRAQNERAGGVDATDELDNDIGLCCQCLEVVSQERSVDLRVARRIDVAHADADEFEFITGTLSEVLALCLQHLGNRGSHGSAAEQGNLD